MVDRRNQPFRTDDLRLGALQARALAEGGTRKGRHGAEWNVAGKGKMRCISPRAIHLLVHEGLNTPVGPALYLEARCRICEPCLKARASYWKLAAIREIERAQRTWFVTLTVRPEERLRVIYAADLRLAKAGVEDRCPKEVFRAQLKVLSPHVTRFLKRLRKQSLARFRYLLVWEHHKDGFPHAHLLIHERSGSLTKRLVQDQWKLGFSNCKLVGAAEGGFHKAAAYTCKYISKSMLARVRASILYGGEETLWGGTRQHDLKS